MTKSALKQMAALPSCAGGLSRLVYAHARRMGVDARNLLRKSGLTVGEIENPEPSLGVAQQIRFTQLVAEAVGDENLGAHLAQSYDLREQACSITLPPRLTRWVRP